MKRKIMSINDLYNFCLKNNFSHFSSLEANQEICVQMPATFEAEDSTDKDKEGLIPFVAKAYHDNINLNHSEIKTETLESTLPSAMLRPILASIVVDEKTKEKDFGSHDFTIEEDEEGNEYIKYIEQPVGVIFGENTIEYDKEADVNRAILHGYLFEGYCQDAINIMNRRKTVSCSVELSVRELSFNGKDKVMTLEDFYVSGLTLLGNSVAPGMAGSELTIEDFCEKETKTFSHESKLIEMLEQLNSKLDNLSGFTINNSKLTEGGNETVTKFEELLKQYNKTVEEIDFEYENLSDEELENAFAKAFAESDTEGEGSEPAPASEGEENSDDEDNDDNTDDSTNEGENEDISNDSTVQMDKEELFNKIFELSFEDVRYSLNALCSIYRTDSEWCYVENVYEDYFIMCDWDSEKYYKQSYTVDGDTVNLFGERIEMFKIMVTESEKIAIEDLRANYSSIQEKLEKLEAYEKDELKSQKEAIFGKESYSNYLECDEFTSLKNDMDNYSVEELTEKAELAFAKCVQKLGFSLEEKPIEKKHKRVATVTSYSEDTKSSYNPYGDLFDEE